MLTTLSASVTGSRPRRGHSFHDWTLRSAARAAWRGRNGTFGLLPLALVWTVIVGNMSVTDIARKHLWFVLAIAVATEPVVARRRATEWIPSNHRPCRRTREPLAPAPSPCAGSQERHILIRFGDCFLELPGASGDASVPATTKKFGCPSRRSAVSRDDLRLEDGALLASAGFPAGGRNESLCRSPRTPLLRSRVRRVAAAVPEMAALVPCRRGNLAERPASFGCGTRRRHAFPTTGNYGRTWITSRFGRQPTSTSCRVCPTVDTFERAGFPGRRTESKVSLDGKDQRHDRDFAAHLLAQGHGAKVLGRDGSDGPKHRRRSDRIFRAP